MSRRTMILVLAAVGCGRWESRQHGLELPLNTCTISMVAEGFVAGRMVSASRNFALRDVRDVPSGPLRVTPVRLLVERDLKGSLPAGEMETLISAPVDVEGTVLASNQIRVGERAWFPLLKRPSSERPAGEWFIASVGGYVPVTDAGRYATELGTWDSEREFEAAFLRAAEWCPFGRPSPDGGFAEWEREYYAMIEREGIRAWQERSDGGAADAGVP